MKPITNSTEIRLILLFPYSLTAFDATKFGFDTLLAHGVDLQVFDLSPLISARNDKNAEFLTHDYIQKIHSYDELEIEIKRNLGSAVYIDHINGVNGFQWRGRRIFKLFKKYAVTYHVVEVGALPIFAPLTANALWVKIKNIFKPKRLHTYLKWKFGKIAVYYQWKLFRSYQLPTKIFIGNSESRQRYIKKYKFNEEDIIAIHSFDYDRYLHYLRSTPAPFFPDKKIAVFLDQMLATHCDFGKSVSFSPVTAEKYLPAINHFFDKIENELGLSVVIAASPRADYETNLIFGKRKVISGKTLELVAESELVLMHTTTAVSFAILFDKPILLMKTKEMAEAAGYANFLNNMAASLNLQPLCIDDENALQQFDFTNYISKPRNYDSYKYKYVMSKNTHDKITWEILLDTLSQNKEFEYEY